LARALQEQDIPSSLLCETWQTKNSPFSKIHTLHQRIHCIQEFSEIANRKLQELSNNHIIFAMERGICAHVYRAGDGVHAAWLSRRANATPKIIRHCKNIFNTKNKIYRKLEQFTFNIKNTEQIIANSAMVKNDILKFTNYPETKISVIHNGVKIERFSSGNRDNGRKILKLAKNDFVVLLIGHGKERKGHRQAQRIIKHTLCQPKLIIVDKAQACPVEDLYAAADVFLLPTLYDPFANVTLEAMAAGLPVITTYANGASEVIHHCENGFLLKDAYQIRQASQIIDQLYQSKELHENISRKARKCAMNYSLEQHVKDTIGLIKQIQY
ncbi:MAG: glycosyltransferase family 4 protein, partial [Verrucomicrobiota bacterium]